MRSWVAVAISVEINTWVAARVNPSCCFMAGSSMPLSPCQASMAWLLATLTKVLSACLAALLMAL
ncbi:hypothetical protein D3C80_2155710 [compost metagenome]